MFGGGNRDHNNGPPVWLIMIVVSIVVYAISYVLIRTISRYREYAADRGAAIITGAPEHLMSALQKISSQMTLIPQQDLREVEGMNAFFIIPAKAKAVAGELFATHPPLEKRLAALAEIARRDGPPGRVAAAVAVGLRDVLFGRKKLSEPSEDRLFALATAAVTLETELGLKPAGVAAVTFKPLSSGDFDRVDGDVEELLRAAGRLGRLEDRAQDRHVRLRVADRPRPDFEDLVTTVHLVASELKAQGFGAQLLAAPFRFEGTGSTPSTGSTASSAAPSGRSSRPARARSATTPRELELKAKLEKELPIEQDLTRWLGLFDAPI